MTGRQIPLPGKRQAARSREELTPGTDREENIHERDQG